jgi:hypothetical protein
MLLRWMIALAALFAGAASAAAAPSPVELQPSSKWLLDYAKGYCRLARQFGTDGQKTIFYIEQYEPDVRYTALAAGRPFRSQALRKPAVRFGPGKEAGASDRITPSVLGDYGDGILVSDMPLLAADDETKSPRLAEISGKQPGAHVSARGAVDPRDAGSITTFELLDRDVVRARLLLGPMDAPIGAMNACTEELLTHWGIDVAEHRTRISAPQPKDSPGNWVVADDYPREMVHKGQQGLVWFRLNVDEQGIPTACEIQQKTDPPAFGDIVCRLVMKKARFHPAINAEGKPMKSYWRTSVRFTLP